MQPDLRLPAELSMAEKLLRLCWTLDASERPSMELVMEELEAILRSVVDVEGGVLKT